MPDAPKARRPLHHPPLQAALVLLAALLAHAGVLGHGYLPGEAPSTLEPHTLDAVAARDLAHVLSAPRADVDQPLARVVLRIAETSGGPAPHHAASLLLHGLASLALLLALRAHALDAGLALLASLLFAAHPALLEPTATIAMQGRALAALFVGLAIAAAARGRTWLASGATLLALASHPMAWPTGALLLVVHSARSRSVQPAPRGARAPLHLAALLGLAVLVTSWSFVDQLEVPLGARAAYAPAAAVTLLPRALVPLAAVSSNAHPAWTGGQVLTALVGGALFLVLALVLWRFRRHDAWRLERHGLAWFLAMALGASLLPYGAAFARDADALLALPGALVALCALGLRISEYRPALRVARVPLALLLVLGAGALSRARAPLFESTDALTRAALARNPDDALALARRGDDLLRRGKLTAADEAFERLGALAPQRPHALLGLARIAHRHPRMDLAQAHVERVLAHTAGPPLRAADELLLGTHFLRLGDEASAARHFVRAVERAPRFLRARTRLAVTLAGAGRLEEARRLARETTRLEPAARGTREAWLALGMVAELEGDPPAARQAYEAALALEPDYAEALVNLGRLLVDEVGLADGLPVLQRAWFLHPLFLDAIYEYARASHLSGSYDQAADLYRKTLNQSRERGHMRALVGLGWTHLAGGRSARARDLARMALERNASHVGARELLVWVHRVRGEWEEALALASEVAAQAPDGAAARLHALLLAAAPEDALRSGARAVQLAEAFVERTGESREALRALAAARAEVGRFALAREAIDGALALPLEHALAGLPTDDATLRRERELYAERRALRLAAP